MLGIEVQKHSLTKDILFTVLFGVLSILLSKVQFQIPGVGDSNLREIPLLICLFHFRNPLFVFALSLFTLSSSPPGIPLAIVYAVHLFPLLVGVGFFIALQRLPVSATLRGVIWIGVTVVYYLLLLLPLVVFAISFLPENTGKNFWMSYQSILPHMRFEVITSSLVTGLYLMQMETRRTLQSNNRNLEQIVNQRTKELTSANNELQSLNEELTASNEGIKELNENLEQLVKERTDKINDQLEQLRKYAKMNSHELRAPLARMLGLLQLLKQEKDPEQMKELLKYLQQCSIEFDQVIREMNRVLEKEIMLNEN